MSRVAVKREKLFFPGPAGRLEAVLEYPRNEPVGAAGTVCHPHPQYRGTMENKVVYTLARAAVEAGAVALRFNFRGVGKSEGRYGEGRGELEDFRAAEHWLEARYPNLARWRLGFSFGAAIVIAASVGEPCDRLVTVAPPADRLQEYGLSPEAAPQAGRWLLVQGDADEVVSPQAALDWARSLASPPESAMFEGVGHYFHGHLTPLRERVRKALVADKEE
ncbi:MAG: alpha/beta hydrolase [Gammaproteobacteria bacterium]